MGSNRGILGLAIPFAIALTGLASMPAVWAMPAQSDQLQTVPTRTPSPTPTVPVTSTPVPPTRRPTSAPPPPPTAKPEVQATSPTAASPVSPTATAVPPTVTIQPEPSPMLSSTVMAPTATALPLPGAQLSTTPTLALASVTPSPIATLAAEKTPPTRLRVTPTSEITMMVTAEPVGNDASGPASGIRWMVAAGLSLIGVGVVAFIFSRRVEKLS